MSSEIGVRLTGDNSEFRAMMRNAVDEGTKTAGQLTTNVGEKLFGLKNVASLFTASLALNVKDAVDGLARFASGVSKETEDAFRRAAEASRQTADAAIANMRARLNEEQKYRLGLAETAKLQREVDDLTERMGAALATAEKYSSNLAVSYKARVQYAELLAKQQEKSAELERSRSETITFENKQLAEAEKQREAARQAEYAAFSKRQTAALAALDVEERQKALVGDIAALRATINSGLLTEAERKQLNNTLAERELQLSEAITKARGEERSAAAELSRLRFEALPAAEKLAWYQESIATLEKLIADQKKAGLSTWKDELALAENRLEVQKLITQETGATRKEEEHRLETIREQNRELEAQVEQKEKLNSYSETTMTIDRTGADYESQSTAALQGVRDRLKTELTRVKVDVLSATPLRDGSLYNPGASFIALELERIERELAMRTQVSAYAHRYGENAAVYKFGDANMQRAARDPLYFDKIVQESPTADPVGNEVKSQLKKLNGYMASIQKGLSPVFKLPPVGIGPG